MLTKLSVTFGSQAILQSIVDQHPDRQFKMMQASTHSNKIALFDFSNQESVFKSPVKFIVLNESLNSNTNGMLYYQSFQVNGDRQQMLNNVLNKVVTSDSKLMNGKYLLQVDNRDESTTLVLLTSWNELDDLMAWKKTTEYQSLIGFTNPESSNYYYDETYRPLR